ncbi:sigma-70 family RNA polymerase sigma factor [Streptomyces sp. MA15]|uniref:RNA polymerase sigma factor n=1 Tax=Streptomyces TaxID=1883 RepID=UPI0025B2698F|nr:sigma-70 family RNA polymerase sigma factor [Streptomyces sp. MA15]MDN3270081.1 sigma-70 family RNA polymerase sigma factor [Streptomyces sp. MA15]
MSHPAPDPPVTFQAFYQRYHVDYLQYAYLHLGDRAAAVETVELVFVQLLETWPKVLTQPSVQRYAHSVLRRTLANQVVLRHGGTALVETATFAKVRMVTRRQLEVMESSLGLYAAIARLPERQMDVIVMRFILGYDVTRVADILGVSVGTVRSHIHAARRRLARELGVQYSKETEAEEIA